MNGGSSTRRKMGAPLSNRSKERDEDLILFQEMHKRDKNRVVSLLQPVSDEFEPNGNYPLYGMATAKKGPGFLGESHEKNDYDWLKTPPATPLFPSLEMETKNPHQELVVQRELPIIQPLSRFAGKQEEKETKETTIVANSGKPKPTTPRPRVPPRSVTPSGRSSSLFPDYKKNIKTAPIPLTSSVNKTSVTDLTNKPNTTSPMSKPLGERDGRFNQIGSNQSKSMQGMNSSSRTTQKTRGVSPLVTSRITQFPGFSDETPANLRTDRSTSASRARPVNPSTQTVIVAAPQKPDVSTMRGRRQSCSPSVTRGRKVAPANEESTNAVTAQKGSNSSRMFQGGNGGQFLGSRMVDKMMNARKLNIEEKKLNSSINEGSGYGRITSKGLLDTETKRDSVHSRPVGSSSGRKSTSTTYAPSSRSSGGSYRAP